MNQFYQSTEQKENQYFSPTLLYLYFITYTKINKIKMGNDCGVSLSRKFPLRQRKFNQNFSYLRRVTILVPLTYKISNMFVCTRLCVVTYKCIELAVSLLLSVQMFIELNAVFNLQMCLYVNRQRYRLQATTFTCLYLEFLPNAVC